MITLGRCVGTGLLGAALCVTSGWAQEVRPARPDTVRVGASALVQGGDTLRTLPAADTVRLSERQTAQLRRIIPRKATIKSAMLPGLGQAYNRQYWKIPIIYGGFATIGYFINFMNGRMQFYRTNWEKAFASPDRTVLLTIGGFTRPISEGTLERGYNTFRRYRDLNVLLGVALWGLNIMDANVSAHLKTFDLTDDLSLRLQPSLGVGGAIAPPVVAPGVRLTLTFN